MIVGSMEELYAYLDHVHTSRAQELRCELTPELSAQLNDAALSEVLITGLPMAQEIRQRIVRSRGRGITLTATLRYREGVRMAEYWRSGEGCLTAEEVRALQEACYIAAEAIRQGGEGERLRYLLDWVCRNIRYVHTAPGRKGYDKLVGAAGVLQDHAANCQGFADVMYLLCRLSGFEAAYRCGRGRRQIHLWNAVRVDGEWIEIDASKAARGILD